MKRVKKCKMFVLLLHDNASLHTRFVNKRSHLQNWVMLCCPIHHTAQIWPQSDLYLFDPLKNAICGLKFRDDDEVIKKLMM
jgi:extradiol dioxygenase family protein